MGRKKLSLESLEVQSFKLGDDQAREIRGGVPPQTETACSSMDGTVKGNGDCSQIPDVCYPTHEWGTQGC